MTDYNENSKINTVNKGGSPRMAMMKTWNNQGFVVKCSKKNDDYTTKNQNNKVHYKKRRKKKQEKSK
jgi:hypothetical protein